MKCLKSIKRKLIIGCYIILNLFLLQGCGGSGGSSGTSVGKCTAATPPTFSSVQTIFANNCDYCHGHTFQNYSTALSDSANIYTRVSNGSMPQGATLSAADLNAIEQWVSCGSKQ
ncbi:MAG: c-type cytochrome [Bdellovibrio sp.]